MHSCSENLSVPVKFLIDLVFHLLKNYAPVGATSPLMPWAHQRNSQVQTADETGELLGQDARLSAALAPSVLPNANHAEAESHPHHARRFGVGWGWGGWVCCGCGLGVVSWGVRRWRWPWQVARPRLRWRQTIGISSSGLRIAVIHPHLRIGNVSLSHTPDSSLLCIFARLDLTGGTWDLPSTIARIGLESSRF